MEIPPPLDTLCRAIRAATVFLIFPNNDLVPNRELSAACRRINSQIKELNGALLSHAIRAELTEQFDTEKPAEGTTNDR